MLPSIVLNSGARVAKARNIYIYMRMCNSIYAYTRKQTSFLSPVYTEPWPGRVCSGTRDGRPQKRPTADDINPALP